MTPLHLQKCQVSFCVWYKPTYTYTLTHVSTQVYGYKWFHPWLEYRNNNNDSSGIEVQLDLSCPAISYSPKNETKISLVHPFGDCSSRPTLTNYSNRIYSFSCCRVYSFYCPYCRCSTSLLGKNSVSNKLLLHKPYYRYLIAVGQKVNIFCLTIGIFSMSN